MTNYVKDSNGNVAVVYYQPIPKLVKYGQSSAYFECKFGVSLALVPETDLPTLLGLEGGCCGRKRKIISLANENQYKHWLNGLGGR